jgi:hypothetical protein
MLAEASERGNAIATVSWPGAEGTALLRGAAIDRPQSDDQIGGWTLRLSGWALGRESVTQFVEIVNDGVVLKKLPLSIDRPDVISYSDDSSLPLNCGFDGLIGLAALEPTFELFLRAVLEDGTKAAFGRITGSKPYLRMEAPYAPDLAPLFVTSLGRSGSTLIMDLLRRHSEIVVGGDYPFEFRPGCYWLHQVAVLSQPADHWDSVHPDSFYESSSYVGTNPFFQAISPAGDTDWLAHTYPAHLAAFAQQSIDSLYGELAVKLGKPTATFFAEKHVPDRLQWLAMDLYPEGREIILVRDFRDTLASILAFNDKRGYAAFGRADCGSDEEYVDRLAAMADRLRLAWVKRGDRAHLVRYEDLVKRPREVLERLLSYLGVESEDLSDLERVVRSPSGELSKHRTTSKVNASIGRWESDLPVKLHALCNQRFQSALHTFGYD